MPKSVFLKCCHCRLPFATYHSYGAETVVLGKENGICSIFGMKTRDIPVI